MGSCSGPVLEFKENVNFCPKRASYADVFLPDWWKLKVLVTIGLNRFSSCTHTPLWYIALFTISHFLLQILRSAEDGRDFLLLWFLKDLQKGQKQVVKSTERILKKFCNGSGTLVGQRRNASCFVIFRINHFQKNKHSKENITS